MPAPLVNDLPSAAAPVDPRQFRAALGAFTTGVTIVTTQDAEGRDVGLTANSFNSVSLTPPMVLWSLAKSSNSLGAFVDAAHFAVHILAADQEPLSTRFATRGIEKFAGLDLARGHGGIPLLDGCAARFECRTAFRYEGGDHEIFVGEVITFEHFDRAPLVFHGGNYAMAVKLPRSARAATESEVASRFEDESLATLLDHARHAFSARLARQPENAGVHLTPAGDAARIESLAAAKAAEEDASRMLAESEQRMLRHLLKRLIAGDD